MKKLPVLAVLIFGLFYSEANSQNIPKFDGTGYCQDFADVLSLSEEKDLNNRLDFLKEETGIEFSLVTVASLEGYDIETYANKLFHEWGIGDRTKDNGLLLLLAINDRKSRLEVGYGLEPYITDAFSRRVLENMKPFLKQGNIYGAYLESIFRINEELVKNVPRKSEYSPKTEHQSNDSESFIQDKNPNKSVDSIGFWSFIFSLIAILGFFVFLAWLISLYLEKRNKGLIKRQEFLQKINKLYDEASALQHFIGHVNMSDIQSRHESIYLMIEKLKAFSDTQKVESLLEYHYQQTNDLIEDAQILKRQKEEEERKKREEEERKKREEEERLRSIKSENSLKEKAEKLLKLGEMHFVNFFNHYEEKFVKNFPKRKFITMPGFSYFLESIKQEVDNTKGDGKNEISLKLSLDKLEDCTRKIENFYAKSIEDRDNVVRIQKQYERILDSFTNKLGNSEVRKQALSNAVKSYDKASILIIEDNLVDAQQLLNNVHLNIKMIEESFREENDVKSKASSLGYKIDSTRRLVNSSQTRRILYERLDKLHSEIVLAFGKNLEFVKDPDNMTKIKQDLKLAENLIEDIEKDYREEQRREERKREEQRREEERRRRRREEEEEERRRSYSSYNYSSGSYGSWDSGSSSSFGGGDSGGGGASSDW